MLINALRWGAEPPDGASRSDVALWLGVLWGEELCRLGGWNWIYLITDEGLEGAAVVDPRRSRAEPNLCDGQLDAAQCADSRLSCSC